MRILLLLRGLPASGKSTFVEQNKLQDYTVSSDNLRQLFGSNELTSSGKFSVNQSISSVMWPFLMTILERRFTIGAFTVFDATNIKSADMSKAVKLAKEYRYRVYCVDFTDVSFDECLKRDMARPELKRVGKHVLERMNANLKNNSVPSGVQIIRPQDWLTETKYRTLDISNYKRVHHIGDIHGCYTALQNYLNGTFKDDEFYIFIGDYIDRGIENTEMIEFISSISNKENVILLEGNHEIWLKSYIDDTVSQSPEFEKYTRLEFDSFGSTVIKKHCKKILNKLRQCFIYKWNGKIVLCTHGGLSRLPSNLSLINTSQLIKGVGIYQDMLEVNTSFEDQNLDKEIYQVHGHRNVEQVATQVNSRCFNLCEHIEYGGNLRSLILDDAGFHVVLTKNPVYNKGGEGTFDTVGDMKDALDSCANIKVVKQGDSSIYSYNFTREAFQKGIWNDITIKARGLFINNNTSEIVARGYEKFFNVNETPETNLDVLPNTLNYPVNVYKKENGFLGLLGFDRETDSLLFCSKSEIDGVYSNYFKDILLNTVDEKTLFDYMKPHNVTLVFEVIDVKNDPHIIKYQKNKVVLLDIIENVPSFKNYSFDKVRDTANILGFESKELCTTLNTSSELLDFFKEIKSDDYKWKNRFIEGFVFTDASNYMFKFKCEYYRYWKYMRGQVEGMRKSGKPKIDNPFLNWVQQERSRTSQDIITLRKLYFDDVEKKR